MRILVLGGYGLIGSAIMRQLLADGHEVTGLGRDVRRARRLIPQARWTEADMRRLSSMADWAPILAGIDAVVNAAGALQTGGRDNVTAVQETAILALIAACEAAGIRRFVQISAPMARPDAGTDFMASKGKADAALAASALEWTILRPGLVLAQSAYGGTALIRMLAAQPVGGLIAFGETPVQTVDVDDVAEAVSLALASGDLAGVTADLVEDNSHSLQDIVVATRRWLGFPDFRLLLPVPRPLVALLTTLADLAGWLGWRSPLRSNAVNVLADGIPGDAAQTRAALGRPAHSLAETFARRPSTLQDRWHARLSLLFPVLITLLIAFWAASALIALPSFDQALAVLSALPEPVRPALVIAGIAADLAIAAGLAWRLTTRLAILGGIGLTLAYLAAASFVAPSLWLDPLGPLVKSAALIGLHLAVLPLLEER